MSALSEEAPPPPPFLPQCEGVKSDRGKAEPPSRRRRRRRRRRRSPTPLILQQGHSCGTHWSRAPVRAGGPFEKAATVVGRAPSEPLVAFE